MQRLLKILVLLIPITLLVWLAALWRWNVGQIEPSVTDMALHLGVVPLVLTLSLRLAVVGVKRLRTFAAAPLPEPPSSSEPTGKAGRSASPPPQPVVKVGMVAHFAHVAAGSDWDSVCTSLAENACKPDLDSELVDKAGLPVFTVRHPDIDTSDVQSVVDELLPTLLASDPENWRDFECPPDVLRTMAMLQQGLDHLIPALLGLQPPTPSAPPSGRQALMAQSLDRLEVHVGISSRWSVPAQRLVTHWLEREISARSVMDPPLQPLPSLRIHNVASAEALWHQQEQVVGLWQQDGLRGGMMWLAADSLLSRPVVAGMEARGELFSGRQQQGRVPGEGAGGFVLASVPLDASAASAPALRGLWLNWQSALWARRGQSADEKLRPDSTALKALVSQALEGFKAGGQQPDALAFVASDADGRASRSGEVYEIMSELLGHVDPDTDLLRLGAGCGDLGVARLLACASLAASRAEFASEAGLVLSAHSPFDRWVLVIQPPTEESPAVADST